MFKDFGLHESLVRSTEALGFQEPTPVQEKAIPPAMEGRDLLASAPTGTGKTAAFLLPMLQHLHGKPRGVTRALILTPTRELASQIEAQLRQLASNTRLRAATVVGGVAMGPQVRALRAGVDVLVATPGRLIDHLQYPYTRLDQVEILVLDEADRMLDMGFLPAIRQILDRVPEKRQTMLFSATLPPPIVALAKKMLVDPVRIDLQPKTSAAVGVRQAVYPVSHEDKTGLLLALLGKEPVESALVFTRTKHRANRLAQTLDERGVSCAPIHGNRSQAQRTQALSGFRSGRFRVLVATDIASRGIDVEKLSHVVNFDVPQSAEDYVHRIGRTARAQATGDAWTFVSPAEEGDLRSIERTLGRRITRVKVDGFVTAERAPAAEREVARPSAPVRSAERPRGFGAQPRGEQRGYRATRPREVAAPRVEQRTPRGDRALGVAAPGGAPFRGRRFTARGQGPQGAQRTF